MKVDEVSRQDDQKIRDGIDNAVETLSSGLGSAAGFTTGACAAWSLIIRLQWLSTGSDAHLIVYMHCRVFCWFQDGLGYIVDTDIV